METHIADITHAIQLAVAPVFLLTAIGTLITALNNRLGRAVDRRRILQDKLLHATHDEAAAARAELATLAGRSRLIYFSILAAVTAGLLVCLVVACAFVGALLTIELSKPVAVLFILAMGALVVSLALFLREIFLAVSFVGLKLRR
ncbi:MAG TPA: DUF2721 domain-containing protein [Casimicrobiaceae bacterium]|nr:DUF2721 domain-containing protein [Casimicrobiaceae bacterium]